MVGWAAAPTLLGWAWLAAAQPGRCEPTSAQIRLALEHLAPGEWRCRSAPPRPDAVPPDALARLVRCMTPDALHRLCSLRGVH